MTSIALGHTDNESSSSSVTGAFPPTAIVLHKSVPEEVCRLASDQTVLVDGGSIISVDFATRETATSGNKLRREKITKSDFITIDTATESVSKWLSGTFSLACSRFHVLVIGGNQPHEDVLTEAEEDENLSASLRQMRQRDHTEFDCLTHSICPGFQNDTILPQQLSRQQQTGIGENNDLPMRIVSYFDGEHAYREYCFWNCDVLFDEKNNNNNNKHRSSSSTDSVDATDDNDNSSNLASMSPARLSSILSMSVSLGFAAVVWYPPRSEDHAEMFANSALQLVDWKKQFVQGMHQTMANRPQELLGMLDHDEYHLLLRDMVVSHRLTLSYPHEMLPFIDEVIEELAPSETSSDATDNEGEYYDNDEDADADGNNNQNNKPNLKIALIGALEHQQSLVSEDTKNPLPPLSVQQQQQQQQQQQKKSGIPLSPSTSLSSPKTPSSQQIYREEINRLQKENLELRRSRDPFESKIETLERENAMLKAAQQETEQSSSSQSSLKRQNETLSSKLESASQEQEESLRKLSRVKLESETEAKVLRRKLNEESEKNSFLEEKLQAVLKQQQQEEEQKSNKNSRLHLESSSSHQQQQHEEEMNKLRGHIERMDRSLLEAERQNSSLQHEVERLKTINNSSRASTPLSVANNNNTSSSAAGSSSALVASIREQERSKTERIARELEDVKKTSSTKIVELNKENKQLQQEIEELNAKLKSQEQDQENKMHEIKQSHEEAMQRLQQEHSEAIEKKEAETVVLRKTFEDDRELIKNQHKTEIEELNQQQQTVISKNNEEKQKLWNEFDGQLKTLTAERDSLQLENEKKTEQISSLENDKSAITKQLEVSDKDAAAAHQEIASLNNHISDLDQRLLNQRDNQKSVETSLLVSTSEQKEKSAILQSENMLLSQKLEEAEKSLEEMQKKLDLLTSTLEQEQTINEALKATLEEERAKNIASQEHEQLLNNAKDQIKDLEEKHSSLEQQLESTETDLRKTKADLEESEEKRANLRSAHKTTCDSLAIAEKQRRDIETESAKAAEQMQDLETFRTVRDLEEKLQKADSELVVLRESNTNALSDLEMERRTNARLSLELAKIDKEMLRQSFEQSEKVPVLLAELKRVKRVANEMAIQVEAMKDESQIMDDEERNINNSSTILNNNNPSFFSTPFRSTNISDNNNNNNNLYQETKEALRQSEAQNAKLTQELQLLHLHVTNMIDQVGSDAQKEALRVSESAKLRATINSFIADQEVLRSKRQQQQQQGIDDDDEDEENISPISSSPPRTQQQQRGEELHVAVVSSSSSRPPLSPSTPPNQSSIINKTRRSATSPPSTSSSPNSARKKLLMDAAEYQRRELEWQNELRKLKEENINLAHDMLEKKTRQNQAASLALIWNAGKEARREQEEEEEEATLANNINTEGDENENERSVQADDDKATRREVFKMEQDNRSSVPSTSVLMEALDHQKHVQNMNVNRGRMSEHEQHINNTTSNTKSSTKRVDGKVRCIYL